MIAQASAPASMTWPEPWSLHNRESNLITSISPITYLKCRPSRAFTTCPLSCLIHAASLGHLYYSSQYRPTIPPPHFTTAKNHICSTYGTSTFYYLPDLSHHATFYSLRSYMVLQLCVPGRLLPTTWTGHQLQSLPHSRVTGRQCGVVNEHDMSMGILNRSGFKSFLLHLHKFLNSARTQRIVERII